MPKISNRGVIVPASPIRKLAPYAVKANEEGVKVYGLNIGQPDVLSPKEGLDILKKIDLDVLSYTASDGLKSYREKLVGYYAKNNININADDIIITTGGSEALLFAFMATLNDGDEIIIQEPCYANYISLAISVGATVKQVPSSIEDAFALPPIEKYEELITEKTKGILVCNPSNPTGHVYTKSEMEKLAEIVKKHDLFLYSDEVYREFVYSEEPLFSALNLKGLEDNSILIDSVSKRYNECGIRIGAVITRNKELHNTIMKFCQARLSPPLLGQLVAEASLDASDDYMTGNYEEYLMRRNFFIDRLNKIPGVFSPMPNGAFYTIAQLPVEDAEDFCTWCLTDFRYNNETIFMAPATGFYVTPGAGKKEVRIAYVLKIEDLEKSLIVLEKALEEYNKRG